MLTRRCACIGTHLDCLAASPFLSECPAYNALRKGRAATCSDFLFELCDTGNPGPDTCALVLNSLCRGRGLQSQAPTVGKKRCDVLIKGKDAWALLEIKVSPADKLVIPESKRSTLEAPDQTKTDCSRHSRSRCCSSTTRAGAVRRTPKRLAHGRVRKRRRPLPIFSECPDTGWFLCSSGKVTRLDISGCQGPRGGPLSTMIGVLTALTFLALQLCRSVQLGHRDRTANGAAGSIFKRCQVQFDAAD
jgi:hypothetical protein